MLWMTSISSGRNSISLKTSLMACSSHLWKTSMLLSNGLKNSRVVLLLLRKPMEILKKSSENLSNQIQVLIKNKLIAFQKNLRDSDKSLKRIGIMHRNTLRIWFMKCLTRLINRTWLISRTDYLINWEKWSNRSSTSLQTKMMLWNDSPSLVRRLEKLWTYCRDRVAVEPMRRMLCLANVIWDHKHVHLARRTSWTCMDKLWTTMHGRNCRSETQVRELLDMVKDSPRSYLTWSQVISSRQRIKLEERVEVQDVTQHIDRTNRLTTHIWTTTDNQLQLIQGKSSSIIGQLIQASIVLVRLLVTLESIPVSGLDTLPLQRIQVRVSMKFSLVAQQISNRHHNASPKTAIVLRTKRVMRHSRNLVATDCMDTASTNETNNK